MSIEVWIPLCLCIVILYIFTEINSSRIKTLQKRVKELESTGHHTYNGHWEEHKKRWPPEDR